MIKVIGAKRILGLMVLLGVNAVLVAGVYLYLMPKNEKLTRELNATRSNISTKTSETARLKNEFETIQKQRAAFEDLKASGFLGGQDRVVARERVEAIQAYSDVLLANYSFQPVSIEENEHAAQSGQVILRSELQVNVDVIDDVDFYKFVYWLENGFPGHIAVNNVEVTKEEDVNDVTLRQIGNSVPIVMGRGTVDVTWRTMVPPEEVGPNLTERN